jgi:hypothetical protein
VTGIILDLSPNTSADGRRMRIISGSPQSKALGRKVSDEFTIPLCRNHHREVHRCGDEAAWWKNIGIDPTVSARSLWLESHPRPVGEEEATADVRLQPNAH